MIKETITYVDFNGTTRTEDYHFNLTRTELLEIAMDLPAGLTDNIAANENKTDVEAAALIFSALGGQGVTQFFKKLILKAYGVKSLDGRRFEKSEQLSTEFSQTPAFDQLYYEIITSDTKAADFVNALIPESVLKNAPAALPKAVQ
jgi:hypothetical protein